MKNKKNAKIAAATGITLFSLVAVFTATIAWFVTRKHAQASQMNVVVKEQGQAYKSGLTIHRCLTNESSTNNLSFNHSAATTSQYKIDDYSQLNTTQPVLMLFPMGIINETTGEPAGVVASEVSLVVTSSTGAGYANVNTTDSSAANYFNKFPFSSACSFRIVAWSGDVPTDVLTNPTRYYVQYTSIGQNDTRCYVGETQSFVTPGANTLTWNGPTLTLFNGSSLPNFLTTTIKYLGVVIDYYQPALTVIFRAGGYAGPNPLNFLMDFTMVIS